jgi:hypothetical protein
LHGKGFVTLQASISLCGIADSHLRPLGSGIKWPSPKHYLFNSLLEPDERHDIVNHGVPVASCIVVCVAYSGWSTLADNGVMIVPGHTLT